MEAMRELYETASSPVEDAAIQRAYTNTSWRRWCKRWWSRRALERATRDSNAKRNRPITTESAHMLGDAWESWRRQHRQAEVISVAQWRTHRELLTRGLMVDRILAMGQGADESQGKLRTSNVDSRMG